MSCDLASVFEPIATIIPTAASGKDHFLFTAQTLPIPPDHMTTDQMFLRKYKHGYNASFYVDALWWYAPKATFRQFALLMLSVLLHENPSRVQLSISHPASDIKHIFVDYSYVDLAHPGYHSRPVALSYYPDVTDGYLLRFRWRDVVDYPCFWLTNLKECIGPDEDWARRDVLSGFGNDYGSAWFAELLLNASRPDNPILEYDLEGEAGGRRCVGVQSAEVKLILPGSIAWNESEWQMGWEDRREK